MKTILLSLLGFAVSSALSAAPATVDPAFASTAGQVFAANQYGGVASVLVQPDGKILFGSNEMAATVNGTPLAMSLTRFNPDGSVDNTFLADNEPNGSDSGIFYDGQGWPETHALGLLSDGKIVAAGVMQGVRTGTFGTPGTMLRSNSIVRFNPDGTIDTSFQTGGSYDWPFGGLNFIDEVVIQPDDKTIALGGFGGFRNTYNGSNIVRYGIARLEVNGQIDPGFNVDPAEFGAPSGVAALRGFFNSAAIDPSGKIYVTGYFQWGYSYPAPVIHVCARLFPNGQRDYGFNPTLPTNLDRLDGIVLEPNGKLVVLGQYKSPTSTSWMTRLNSDGSPAGNFTLDPTLGPISARPLQADPNGKYLLATAGSGPRSNLVRIQSNGSLDSSFSASSTWTDHPGGTAQSGYFGNFTTSPSGTIYSGSGFDSVSGVSTHKVVSFEGDAVVPSLSWAFTSPSVGEQSGQLQLTVNRIGPSTAAATVNFNTAPGTATAADFTATSGSLSWPAGISGPKTISIPITQDALNEGDETFTVTLSAATGAALTGPATITATLIDDDVAPVITTSPASVVVKEGLPATLSVGVSSPIPVTYQWKKGTVVIPDATSAFYSISATTLASAGEYSVIITSTGGIATSSPATLTVLPPVALVDLGVTLSGVTTPGKFTFLTDGSMLMLDGSAFNGFTLRKLDASFTVDPSFTVTTVPLSGYSANSAYPSPTALPNGQFLAFGYFSEINGLARKYLARLDADGSIDPSFNPFFNGVFEMNGYPTSLNNLAGVAVSESGAVYVMVKSVSQGSRLYRLLADGSADPTFSVAFNYSNNAGLSSLLELADGSILIGYTSGSSGSFQRGIRKVLANGTFDAGFNASTNLNTSVTEMLLLPGNRFAAIRGGLLEIRDLNGTLLQTHTFTGTISSIQNFRSRLLLTGVSGFNGTPLPGIGLISHDGILDEDFPGGAGPNSTVSQAYVDPLGRILVSGSFSLWNGTPAAGFARLLVDRSEIAIATPVATVMENGGPVAFQIFRYGNSSNSASVRATSTDGTATSPADFTAINQVVTWAADDASPKTVQFVPSDDTAVEGNENLVIELSEATGAVLAAGQLTITLRDDDSLPNIISPPVAATGVLGKPISFGVTATSPTALSYQWLLNGISIPSATSASYSISSLVANQEGSYSVRITNDYDSIVTVPVNLAIIPDPTLIASGYSVSPGLNSTVNTLAPAPDGAVYAGGFFTDAGGNAAIDYLAKINPDGSVDTTFVPPALNNQVKDLAVQADGKIIAVGTFTTVAGSSTRRLVRLNSDGTLDSTFETSTGTNGDINTVAIQPDGRILIGGSFSDYKGTSLGTGHDLMLLNTDGSLAAKIGFDGSIALLDILPLTNTSCLISYSTTSGSAVKVRRLNLDVGTSTYWSDSSFNYASGRTIVYSMALAPDGNYLFAGISGLYKVGSTGTILTTYPLNNYYTIAVQANGKVVAAGSSGRLARYLADATADPIFTPSGVPNGTTQALSIRSDGKIWLAGAFTSYGGSTVNRIVLINGDAIPLAITRQPVALILDPGQTAVFSIGATGITAINYQWNKNGIPLSDEPGISGSATSTLTLANIDDTDSAVYTCSITNAAGSRTSEPANLFVLGIPQILSINGDVTQLEGAPLTLSVDAIGFGTLSYRWFRNSSPLDDGGVLSGTQTSTLNFSTTTSANSGDYFCLVTNTLGSTPSGPVVLNFQNNAAVLADGFVPPNVDATVHAILPLDNGRVLIGGYFSSASGGGQTSGQGLAVINPDGSVANIPGLSANGTVHAIRRASNGRILLAGAFTQVNGSPRILSARLNADLSLDTIYDPGTPLFSTSSPAFDITEEAAGTHLLVGSFSDYGSSNGDRAVRLAADGTYDPSFAPNPPNRVMRVFAHPDGTATMLGWFNNWGNGWEEAGMCRILANGLSDTSFDYLQSTNFIDEAHRDSSGNFFVARGSSTGFEKVSATGESIPFLTQVPNSYVSGITSDSTGKVLLCGAFTTVNGATRNRLARVLADGSLDPTFDIGSGFNFNANTVEIASDGAIWVGGVFTDYNGTAVNRLVRLKGDAVVAADPFDNFVANLPSGQRGENDDPDLDGLPNLIEFTLGLNPSVFSAGPATTSSFQTGATISGSLDPAKTYRVVEIETPKDIQSVTLMLEATRDLSFSGDATATEFSPRSDHGATETRRYYLTPSHQDAPRLFWRLKATRD
jgi:uncharacterized delta-60 repeat protein